MYSVYLEDAYGQACVLHPSLNTDGNCFLPTAPAHKGCHSAKQETKPRKKNASKSNLETVKIYKYIDTIINVCRSFQNVIHYHIRVTSHFLSSKFE